MTIPIGVLHFQCKTPCPQHTLLHSLEGFMHGVIGHRLNIGTTTHWLECPIWTYIRSYWVLGRAYTWLLWKNVHLRLASCLAIYLDRLPLLESCLWFVVVEWLHNLFIGVIFIIDVDHSLPRIFSSTALWLGVIAIELESLGCCFS